MRYSAILCVVLAFVCGYAAEYRSDTRREQSMYYAGANASLNYRNGAYQFDAVQLRQDTARSNLLLYGFAVGKRYGLTSNLRLCLGMLLNFGGVIEDTLQARDPFLVKNSFFHIGFEPELQLSFPGSQNLVPFLGVGGGLNYMRLREGFFVFDNPRQQIEFTADSDMEPIEQKRWSPHGHVTLGFDFQRRTEIGFSLKYTFKVWKPVEYGEIRDMPITSVSYNEIFYTHMIQAQILFAFDE